LDEEEKAALLLTQRIQSIDDTAGPAVPWRLFLENATLFLPERSTLLCTDRSMCSELRATALQFTKVQVELYLFMQPPPSRAPDLAEAPVWKALGLKGARPEHPWLAKIFYFLLWDDTR
jgi:hypothetical protein